jgi:RNA polymerase sigma factor (sigma-70 family)
MGEPDERKMACSQQLLAAYMSGDRDAFDRIFAQFGQEVFRVVRRFFFSPFDQDEAFQEVWLQLHRTRSRFDLNRHEEFGAWLKQVARNRCIDLLKARSRRVEIPAADVAPASVADQETRLAQQQIRKTLDDFVARLDPQQQRFFELCFVEELSHEQIAQRMGITSRRSKYLKKKLLARLNRHRGLKRMVRP